MINIQVTKKTIFNQFLLWLDPILNLNIPEREVLSLLLTLHNYHDSRYHDKDLLNKELFSKDNLEGLRVRAKLSKPVFNKAIQNLNNKNLIINETINPKLTKYPKDNKYKITIQFNFPDEKAKSDNTIGG